MSHVQYIGTELYTENFKNLLGPKPPPPPDAMAVILSTAQYFMFYIVLSFLN